MSEVEFDPFAGGELLRLAPTTAPQKEIITAAKLSDEANTAFNEAIVVEIKGPLDVALLEKSFNEVIARHDILRATFSPNGEDICLQVARPFSLDVEDLRGSSESEQQRVIKSLTKNIAISPMNLEEGPLLFAWVKQLDDEVYSLIVAAHHLVCDGWSFGILLTELMKIYENGGNAGALPAAESYFDFSEQQAAAQVINADTDFWLERFKQLPSNLDLPLDYNRPALRSFRAARHDLHLNQGLVAKLPKAASQLKSSLVNYVLAGYFTLLHRLTGNTDIVVGLPVAGQAVFNKTGLFGHMVQLLPIRIQMDSDTSFSDLVSMVKKEVLNASEHPNFTFGKLLETIPVDRSRVPLVSTIFNIDQPLTGLKFGNAAATIRSVPRAAESFEIFLNIVPSPNDLLIEATYSSALYKEVTIQSWLLALETILTTTVENPSITLGALRLVDSLPDVLAVMNQTQKAIQFGDVVSEFNTCVEKYPDNLAVVSGDKSLTYAELDQQSSRLAGLLLEQGIQEGSVVGLCCERTEKLLISVLAILKLGAAYLPLDPDFPEDRLVYMLEDSGAVAVIEEKCAPRGVKDANTKHIDLDAIDIKSLAAKPLPSLASSRDRLAYTIYTSGSTGKPKGVRIQNSAMINFLESMADRPGFTMQDKLLAITTLSFDISVLELFLPVIIGGVTVIASREEVKNGDQLAALINKHHITVMQATPSGWRMLLATNWRESKVPQKIKALCGGEPLPPDLVHELLPLCSEFWNMYGPTETTVWSTCKKITHADALITIGTPIANTQIYILDTNQNPVPLSVPGELCIGGEGVTLGYHNRSELNQERFLEHPTYGRIYRTGDVAKLLPAGEIQHLGRMDDQVKLRGYRIELGEIETALVNCNEVSQAAVYLWKLSDQDVRLVACCVPLPGASLETISIRKQLRTVLPGYMVPQYFLSLDQLPLTPNGKIDRRNLPKPQNVESSILGGGGLQTDMEKTIAGIWSSLLKNSNTIGREDNFFDIGGHSLLAMEAIRRIETATGVRLQPVDLVAERLVTIAEKVSKSSSAKPDSKKLGPQALAPTAMRHLSAEQLRLLNRQLALPQTTANNLPAAWVLEGQLDLDLFKSSILRVFERQTALRTVVAQVKSEHASKPEYQLNLRKVGDISLPDYHDFTDRQAPLDAAIADVVDKASTPFQMFNQLLCRAMLYRLSANRHLFAIIPHQLIFDGWSFDIFLREVEASYAAAKEGHAAALEPLTVQYRDFTQWLTERTPDSNVLSFHKRALDAPPDDRLPFNPAANKGHCQRSATMLDETVLNSVESFCERHHLRIHEVLLAALCQAYAQWTDNDVSHIGIPVTGRYIPEAIGLIGGFVSTLPAEFTIQGGNFINTARDIAEQLKVFYQHQDLSYAELVQGTAAAGQPFATNIPVSFAFQDIRKRPDRLADLKLMQIDIDRHQTEYPLEFWTRIQHNGLLVMFDYDDSQVAKDSLDILVNKVANLLKSLDKQEEATASDKADGVQSATKKTLWRRLFQ